MKSILLMRNAIIAYYATHSKLTGNPDGNGTQLSFPIAKLSVPEQTNDVVAEPANLAEVAFAPEIQTGGFHEKPHRFWHFEWQRAGRWDVFTCSIILFVAGILCSAGGIGGGGIYVSVLMLGGGLSVHDAVPLSKSILFFGALSSLRLNMRKTFHGPHGPTTLINYNIIRLVVPASVLGTYVGVFLNRGLPAKVVLLVLLILLVGMSAMVSVMTYRQFKQEQSALAKPPLVQGSSARGASDRGASDQAASAKLTTVKKDPTPTPLSDRSVHSMKNSEPLRSKVTVRDASVSIILLFFVITCGVIRVHAEQCLSAVRNTLEPAGGLACHHPATFYLGNALEKWMSQAGLAYCFTQLLFVIPVTLCALLAWFYSDMCAMQGWAYSHILLYQGVALMTGCLSGLVGIGGGLIFCPFFLLMDIEPSIAVATSSTAVLFTAASTSFQFFFTDRTIVSLMIIYSFVELVSASGGTYLVHFLQDKYLGRKSFITGIVACGVLLSAGFTAAKFSPNSGPIH